MTARPTLDGCRILIVEDEYMLADELQSELQNAGAVVIGPAGTIGAALSFIEAERRMDGAILDANVRGEMVFPVADRLLERHVPFVFTTGYDASVMPPRFKSITRCEKPVNLTDVTRAIANAIQV